jgi:hypothetical protein
VTDFLKLNGIPVPCLDGSVKKTFIEVGDRTVSWDGSERSQVRRRKRSWTGKTSPMAQADAEAWARFINGEGHTCSFDSDTYTSGGVALVTGGATRDAGVFKFGTHSLKVPITTGLAQWSVGLGVESSGGTTKGWTVAMWRYNGAAWEHYVVTYVAATTTTAVYLAGVYTGTSVPAGLTVSSAGVVALANTTGTAIYYDDLQMLHFPVPSDWPASMFALGVAVANLTDLRAEGAVIPNGNRTVVGKAAAADVVQAGLAATGAWTQNQEQVEFTITEV